MPMGIPQVTSNPLIKNQIHFIMNEQNRTQLNEFLRYAVSSFLPKSVLKKFSKDNNGDQLSN